MPSLITLLVPTLLVPTLLASAAVAAELRSDLVIYGGTPAGVIAAVAAAREGASVVVVEPTRWLGGMVAGGLCRTDVGVAATIGGYTREFFVRASRSCGESFLWYAEPKANLATFIALLGESQVTVRTGQRLRSVTRAGERIASFSTEDGTVHLGTQFIDASYEGDLMAGAGVACTFGREARSQYGESLAGFHPMPIRPRTAQVMGSDCPCVGGGLPHYIHGTPAAISGRDAQGRPIPGVAAATAEPGSADRLIQAYTYRVPVTRRPDLRVPFPRPAAYDPARYELLLRLIAAFPDLRFGRIFHLGAIAGGKYDLNAQGLFSSDLPGGNVGYVEGDAATRERIRQDHQDHVQGLLWFLGHDERVPQDLRDQTNAWGLCGDEFPDNGHWPYALYVREARRMIGEYVMTQQDCQERTAKPDAVAVGSFVIDCHIVQRLLAEDGTVRDEGSFQDAETTPYQIPYRSLVPRRGDCANLLVPVCLSASHVAYGSLRMEPVYMALGHASGVAAVLAMRAGVPVQDLAVAGLQDRLRRQKSVLSFP